MCQRKQGIALSRTGLLKRHRACRLWPYTASWTSVGDQTGGLTTAPLLFAAMRKRLKNHGTVERKQYYGDPSQSSHVVHYYGVIAPSSSELLGAEEAPPVEWGFFVEDNCYTGGLGTSSERLIGVPKPCLVFSHTHTVPWAVVLDADAR